jgi:hypothetical protein
MILFAAKTYNLSQIVAPAKVPLTPLVVRLCPLSVVLSKRLDILVGGFALMFKMITY